MTAVDDAEHLLSDDDLTELTRASGSYEPMISLALFYALAEWRRSKKPVRLTRPQNVRTRGHEAILFLKQMCEANDDEDAAGMLWALKRLCSEVELKNNLTGHDVTGAAFRAGLEIGLLDNRRTQQALGDVRGKILAIDRKRKPTVDRLKKHTEDRKEAAENRRSTLLTFATAMIDSDPHVTTAEIAREFRKVHRPTSALSTDLEDREVSAWRRAGVLPERVLRKIANKSG